MSTLKNSPEIKALLAIHKALDPLSDEQRARLIAYFHSMNQAQGASLISRVNPAGLGVPNGGQ